MNTERINYLHCHRFIRRFRECAGDNIFQLLACTDNTADGRITFEQTIGFDCGPVVIKRDDARRILRHGCVEDTLDSSGDILQNMTVFNQVQFVENIYVRRMNREQINELFQTRGHASIKPTELFQMVANQSFLLRRFLEDTLRNNIGSRFFRDNHLRKTVTDMLECISDKAKARIVENLLLHTKHDTQRGLGTHLA